MRALTRAGIALVVLLSSTGTAAQTRNIPLELRLRTEPERAIITDAGRRLSYAQDGAHIDYIEDRLNENRIIRTRLPGTPMFPPMNFTYEGRRVCTPPHRTDCLYRFDDGVQEAHRRTEAQYASAMDFLPGNQAEYAALVQELAPLVDGEGADELAWRADGERLVELVLALKDDARSQGVVRRAGTGNPPGSTGTIRSYCFRRSCAVLRHNTGNGVNSYVLDLRIDPRDFPERCRPGVVHHERVTLTATDPQASAPEAFFLVHWVDDSLGRSYTRSQHGAREAFREKESSARMLIEELR